MTTMNVLHRAHYVLVVSRFMRSFWQEKDVYAKCILCTLLAVYRRRHTQIDPRIDTEEVDRNSGALHQLKKEKQRTQMLMSTRSRAASEQCKLLVDADIPNLIV